MARIPGQHRARKLAPFARLNAIPPEKEWLANLPNLQTRRAYQNDLRAFTAFAGLTDEDGLRLVARPQVIAWRNEMERRALAPASIRCKLAALSSLFDYLRERHAVAGNPVDGVKRPRTEAHEGRTPALGDRQARQLLAAPPADTLKGVRDRAILATLLYHGLRQQELCALRVKDLQSRQGVMHFRIRGKRGKIRFIPVHAIARRRIEEYLAFSGHRGAAEGALFRLVKTAGPAIWTGRSIRPPSIATSF